MLTLAIHKPVIHGGVIDFLASVKGHVEIPLKIKGPAW